MSRNKNDGSMFAIRLRDERYRRDEEGHPIYDSTEEFAKKIGVSRQTLGFWLNNKRTPDMDGLIKVSKALNMSIDYLVGISDSNSMDIDIQAVTRCTGLSEKAIKAINCEGYKGNMSDFINGFIESKDFYRFVLAFSNTYFLAQNVTADNKDAFLDESLIFENGDCLDITLRITMMDAVDRMRQTMCDYFNKYAHDYFERMANVYSQITVEEITPIPANDDSEVK